MTGSFSVELEGLNALIRKCNDDALIAEPLHHMISKATDIGTKVARDQAGPTVARTISSEVHDAIGRIVATHPAAKVIEGGRKPGAKLPPIGPITDWMASKGIGGSPFVIARAVARRGIKGRFFMRKAKSRVRAALPGLMHDAGAEIERKWGHS